MNDQATELRDMMKAAVLPRSAPTGAVSFGPICSRNGLINEPRVTAVHKPEPNRRLTFAPPQPGPHLAQAIAISSGKGGVGKSNIAVNLAVAMSQLGLKVCLLDADMGLANADVLCNLAPRVTLEQVVAGKCRLADSMMLAPGGFRLIPGASGVTRLAELNHSQRVAILEQLAALEQIADVILIDCGAGIGSNVIGFASAAHQVIVTTTPEPTAITDCYSMVKTLLFRRSASAIPTPHQDMSIRIAVNMTRDEHEGVEVFNRIDRVSQTFLKRPLKYAGAVPNDAAVPMAVRQRMPFVLHAPESEATRTIRGMAMSLAGRGGDDATALSNSTVPVSPSRGFFSRLGVWLGIVEYVEESV